MRSYLGLIPISAKVRKRQNRMTILCIAISVFLVTAVFSMAEMGIRMETVTLQNKHSMSFLDIMKSEMGQTLAFVSGILFLLILLAGVLMISGSINSNVAQRTKFFGMMRCIGMSKQQIIHFVRLEALNWCKTAIPIGLIFGVITTWGLCAILHFVVGEEFSNIPVFSVSIVGIVAGIVEGIITVLIAASSPAKRAAKISPAAAVSGSYDEIKGGFQVVNTNIFKIETALGIQHARHSKKNFVLMTSSVALSIILFLTFSVLTDFVSYLMPQSASNPDIEIYSNDDSNSIDNTLVDKLSDMKGIKCVYGRRSSFDIPATLNKENIYSDTIDLVSFDDFDLNCLKKDGILKRESNLSKVFGDSHYVIATWDKNSYWKIGDKIQIGHEELEIAGLLKYDLFSGDGMTNGKLTLISSAQTFARLTGVKDYSLLMLKTTKGVTEQNLDAVRNVIGNAGIVKDIRDQHTIGTYTAFMFFVYGFLIIITLVTLLNIINSISMSVSARIKQYGAMRAVGMDEHQILKVIASEAFIYTFTGCIVGCAVGFPLNRKLYNILISDHFSYAIWELPIIPLFVILIFVFLAVIISVYFPVKRIKSMAITETINEL